MAKHIGFYHEGHTPDFLASSDAEKAAINEHAPYVIWVTVSDEDYAKVHNSTHECRENGGSIDWGVNHNPVDFSKEDTQADINHEIDAINKWLVCAKATDAASISAWTAYLNELRNLDLDSVTTTFPTNGNNAILPLETNGDITEFRNIKRLP
jgi:hypothetical protein|tara:strand:+ start:5420 stop:5878 length:459 start_codon:yes stop_codon:yes gene_type:complete